MVPAKAAAAGLSLAWMLVCIRIACAAPIRSGDIMLVAGDHDNRPPVPLVQFRGPKGALKASIKMKGYATLDGAAISADRRYAVALGERFDPNVSRGILCQATMFALGGASPKVLGTRITINGGSYYTTRSFAVTSRPGPRGSRVITIYAAVLCNACPAPATLRRWYAEQEDRVCVICMTARRCMTVSKTGKLGAIKPGPTASTADIPGPINHPGDGVAVINNKVYLSQALDKDVRIYELRGNKLVNTWRSKNFPKPSALRLCPTGPSSAIAFDEAKDILIDPAPATNERLYLLAKGRPTYTGVSKVYEYLGVSVKGDTIYAVAWPSASKPYTMVLKSSIQRLKGKRSSKLLFKVPASFDAIAVVP